jgi:hypothetical protein
MSNYKTMQEGQFVLFKNDKKTEPSQPDMTGKIMQGGVEKRMAAWGKIGKNGKFLSGKITDFKISDDKSSSRYQENDDPSADIF